MQQIKAPTVIRTGNLVSDLSELKTHNLPSISAAKRFIRYKLKLRRGEYQSLIFASRAERRRTLWRMHEQLNGRIPV